MLEISRQDALDVINVEAEKIKNLIKNQRNYECISQCKAFEEVVDTQMFGFSKQLEFAQHIGVINRKESQTLILELETELNQLYSDVYDEQKDKVERND
ncbi:DUF1507 family protein [Vagococcus silagei]|uniref:DUF1507 family protein n=1 Tax=Vagococcus silagei TaxID=2508885 RepID=A0A4S3B4F1_9ENTE|nr:DUF1507 family protein [Vagococcus silagei]THB61941.1 DUF1507 family protein [Vagococcus silagei]